MSEPKDKFQIQHPAGDQNTEAAEQDVISNSEEGNKVVNQDSAVADSEGITETLSASEPSTAVMAGTATASDSQIAHGDKPTDAEIAGDDNIL